MKSLTIIGRRWFNPREGNTYYSGFALVDGVEVAREKFAYGYGSQFETDLWQSARAELGIVDDRPFPSWYCRENGIAYHCETIDVQRKQDL